MTREELQNKELNDILLTINKEHGLTVGNSLVSREMTRIYNKVFSRNVILAVKKEAAIRVLCGQNNRVNPLENIKFEI